MLEIILVFSGVAIALYIMLGLLDQAIKWFQQFVLKDTASAKSESQSRETTLYDGLATASQGLPANFDLGPAHCQTHVDICSDSAEVISGFAEGMQGALEGTGEHLGKLVEAIGHAISHTGS